MAGLAGMAGQILWLYWEYLGNVEKEWWPSEKVQGEGGEKTLKTM